MYLVLSCRRQSWRQPSARPYPAKAAAGSLPTCVPAPAVACPQKWRRSSARQSPAHLRAAAVQCTGSPAAAGTRRQGQLTAWTSARRHSCCLAGRGHQRQACACGSGMRKRRRRRHRSFAIQCLGMTPYATISHGACLLFSAWTCHVTPPFDLARCRQAADGQDSHKANLYTHAPSFCFSCLSFFSCLPAVTL